MKGFDKNYSFGMKRLALSLATFGYFSYFCLRIRTYLSNSKCWGDERTIEANYI